MSLKQWSHYIKSSESEPLTRRDLQYDVLKAIFSDEHQVFTHPTDTSRKVSFKDLYVTYISNSPKASKALKDKLSESPSFTEDFAMLALLSNVGRISNSMSFFPEMKTTIRTYHPIPALQRTNGSLQDAPRIKSILKTALLPVETRLAPSVPADILSRASEGKLPPTSVCNLLFVLAYHSGYIGTAHFANELEFMDLFLPVEVSSESRARAFLWLCYHYLESSAIDLNDYGSDTSAGNPFCDSQHPGKAPAFVRLSKAAADLENIDTESEKSLAEKLISDRKKILQNQAGKQKLKDKVDGPADDEESITSASEAQGKGKHKPNAAKSSKENKSTSDRLRKDTLKEQALDRMTAVNDNLHQSAPPEVQHPYPFPPYDHSTSLSEGVRYSPYGHRRDAVKMFSRSERPKARPARRSMVQHAWHIITSSDPLLDSDEEKGTEHDRFDYIQRLRVLTRLRGKDPTPEPERRTFEKRAYLHRPS